MKELSTEEKAKAYDELFAKAKQIYNKENDVLIMHTIEDLFPELVESEDERIKKELISFLQLPHPQFVGERKQEKWIAWLEKQNSDVDNANKEYWRGYREGKQEILDKYAELEKQGDITKLSEEKQNRFAKGVLTSCAMSFIDYLDAHKYEGKMCVSNGECEDIENAFHNAMWDRLHRYYCKYIEKQGEQEQLYIRFGEIPTDEKSKIFRGEIEVGTENGVSVYPAFKTIEGDIVLGLNLPITKTTLYTQQHLVEYDDRPCYLVKGDYVGKDTDGQTLINNVSIIEKIDTYRVKEKKQGESKNDDKVKPKFKDGEWIVYRNGVWQICNIGLKTYYELLKTNNEVSTRSIEEVDANSHLWTIDDAKDGDVLRIRNLTFIFQEITNNNVCHKDAVVAYCSYEDNDDGFGVCGPDCITDLEIIIPATKEQRNLLFQKMHEAGYEWDAEKKELKKIEQKSAEWSEEDEENRNLINTILWESVGKHLDAPEYGSIVTQGDAANLTQWLKTLKENGRRINT